MKKRILLFILISLTHLAWGVEGMWMLPSIDSLNIVDMKRKGFKLSASDIYSPLKPSMLNSVVIFGSGCSGSVISKSGLILTNHHCGFAAIQRLSTVQFNYLKYGYWAYTNKQELPAKGLTVTFIRSIVDVTDRVLSNVPKNLNFYAREDKISKIISNIKTQELKKVGCTKVEIKPFYGGNNYYMFHLDVYSDIRLVGTPPLSIGKFGGDTDNWMWPRHTGDFSLFRVYGTKDGRPAKFSVDNIPLSTPKFFPISIKGVKKGDFAMILGFPGSTNRFLTSFGVEKLYKQDNPIRINVREKRQQILMDSMAVDTVINLKYASKYSLSSNYWKNAIGMNSALERLDVIAAKKRQEEDFLRWASQSTTSHKEYVKSLEMLHKLEQSKKELDFVASYIFESLTLGFELIPFTNKFANLDYELKNNQSGNKNNLAYQVDRARLIANTFYSSYSEKLDRKVAKAMVNIFINSVDKEYHPRFLAEHLSKFNGDVDRVIDFVYNNSIFASKSKFLAFLDTPSYSVLSNDPIYKLAQSVRKLQSRISSKNSYNLQYSNWMRIYIKGYKEMIELQGGKLYPDANFTIRMSYGSVQPYLKYDYKTFLSGLISKEDKSNPYEFTVESKLKELYSSRNLHPYGKKDVVVSFITNTDITGGNSGSPVINGKGELIGVAYDGNWEAMSGDLLFEPELQRTISVDMRYILFIIDKYAGCNRLLDEIVIVR